jgi:GTP cyclohydrolase I
MSSVQNLTAPAGAIDLVAAEAAIAQLLTALGQDAASDRLHATPARAATALLGLVASPGAPEVKLMPAEGYRGLVLVRDIPFQSLCEHHLLPFRGRVHVGFLPGDHLVGLSTLARAVEYVSHGLQLQERMTQQVHDWLQLELNPRGAGVVIQAEHLCMSFRGIGTPDTHLTTSLFSGALGDDAASRSAFFGADSVSADSLGAVESAPPPSRGTHD